MSKIFLGNISAEADSIVKKYLDKYMPDAIIEPLKPAGIKGKIKNHARRPDIVLVILDEVLYNMCVGVADDVLSLPKVHKYTSDASLLEFLVAKFGVLDGVEIPAVKSVVESTPLVEDDGLENLIISDAEDTSNDSDKDSIIQKLNDEIIIRDTMIRNLEAQVEEKSGSEDVSHFVDRIKGLEAELVTVKDELAHAQNSSYADLGKIARAEQIIQSVDSLKEELKLEKEKCLRLSSNKEELETRVTEQLAEVNKLRLNVVELNDKVEDYNEIKGRLEKLDENILSLQEDITSKDTEIEELRNKNVDLETKVAKLTGELAEIGVLTEKVSSLEQENAKLSSDSSSLVQLRVDFENLKVDYSKIEVDKTALQSKLENVILELEESKKSSDSLQLDKEKLERDLSSLRTDNESLTTQLDDLGRRLAEQDDDLERLHTELNETSEVWEELTSTKEEVENLRLQLKHFEDTKNSLSDKISEVEDLQSKLSAKESVESELADKINELTSTREELNSKMDELEKLKNERSSQSSLVTEKDEELNSKQTSIDELTSKVSDLTKTIDELQVLNSDLDISNKKLLNEVEVLRSKTEETSSVIQSSSALEKELTECKREVARMHSENESLKEDLDKSRGTSNKDVEIAKLRSEISDYKGKLRKFEDSKLEQSKAMSDELVQLREKCANLEVSLIEKDDILKSNESNIFSRMGAIASPKTKFTLTLDVPKELPNMYVVAGGSSESNLTTYQTLRRYCSSCNKSVLILDLVTDSYIDREFGVERIVSPIEFLQGTKPIKDFVSKTKVKNTFISSTAFNYLNSLYLLSVDWESVLPQLSGLTDIVIINVGCLNEVVSKVLFNAFSEVMSSHIIIKASPINLRTALLTLSGISSATKSKVSCVNFENSSKQMYQRLAQKFNTQILKDSDVLKL